MMKTNNRYGLFLFTLLFFTNALAQQKVVLTIEKSIELGLQNSKALHSSLMKAQAADSKSNEAHTSLLPSIKGVGAYGRLSDVPPSAVVLPANFLGPGFPPQQVTWTLSQTILNNYNLRFSLQQPIFTGFRLQSAADLAGYNAHASEQDYSKDRADLVYNIRNAYWNLYKANEFKKVVDENVEQVKAHLNDVQNFYSQGIVTKNEVLKVEVQLSNVEVLQLDARNNTQMAMLALNNIIGLPLSTTVEIASEIQPRQKEYGEESRLERAALQERSEVKAMEFRVKAGESGISLARSGWMPQIYLSGNYYYARPNPRIFPTIDQYRDTWDVGISASLDIWNWGATIHQTNQAQAQLAQAQDALAQVRDGITLEVTQAYLNFNQSNERLEVANKGVGQAEENYRITKEKFQSGLALNSDLLDAEAALLQARWNRIQAIVDHELSDARLQKAIGKDAFPTND